MGQETKLKLKLQAKRETKTEWFTNIFSRMDIVQINPFFILENYFSLQECKINMQLDFLEKVQFEKK